jgi:glycosyltransferase involved in cell wall biosynthesis
MKVGVFHPGTQHSWQTALAFQESDCLAWYATSIYFDASKWPYRGVQLLPRNLRDRTYRELSRRRHASLRFDKVKQFGAWEWLEIASHRAGLRRPASWFNRIGNSEFGFSVIRLAQQTDVDALWGYDGASLEVFRWAKRHGILCVLDQTIGHPAAQNEVLRLERERHPEFFFSDYAPFDARWLHRQNEELELADLVVVGSEFCAQTLIDEGCAVEKIRIIPYGYDETIFPKTKPIRGKSSAGHMRCLFVGQIIPRKGVASLLDAFGKVDPSVAKLTLIGALGIPAHVFARYSGFINHFPSLPRADVVPHFAEADCFVFPSLFEGGGIVLYEAGGAGLGVIQSDRCGDGVRSPDAGIVLHQISAEEIAVVVEDLATDKERLCSMQDTAWKGRQDREWSVYREAVRNLTAVRLGHALPEIVFNV